MTEDYAPGDRIELDYCDDPYSQLRPGDQGTVRFVDGVGTVHTDWDSGSRLGLNAEGGDRFHKI
jgi:hypothetical protein